MPLNTVPHAIQCDKVSYMIILENAMYLYIYNIMLNYIFLIIVKKKAKKETFHSKCTTSFINFTTIM